ncbi:hypothetical protein VTO73DRAFT_8877 [Trametes versicolor]
MESLDSTSERAPAHARFTFVSVFGLVGLRGIAHGPQKKPISVCTGRVASQWSMSSRPLGLSSKAVKLRHPCRCTSIVSKGANSFSAQMEIHYIPATDGDTACTRSHGFRLDSGVRLNSYSGWVAGAGT